jgi:aspartate/methionine/tyrosine aminotransferase
MAFQPFAMERWQSTWENRVRYNLSESGVHPLSAAEFLALAGGAAADILSRRLGYPQSNGTDPLRAAVAALYPGATSDHVLITSGSAEANFINCWRLLEPGTEVAIVLPTYMQTWGLARNFGATVREIRLHEDRGWQPDPGEIDAAITPRTRLVVVTNPNNPTGAVMDPALADRIAARADAVGAWLLADEVYQGAEREGGSPTPSFWGKGERVIVVNGLSKAYGLPGLRIGWCVASPSHIAELWARKDYTTIGPTVMSDALATLALGPAVRPRIFERTRGILRANWALTEAWMRSLNGELTWRAPDAGAIVWARYRTRAGSSALAETLRAQHDVLIVPGDQFGMDGYVRLGFGPPADELLPALDRVALAFGREGVPA